MPGVLKAAPAAPLARRQRSASGLGKARPAHAGPLCPQTADQDESYSTRTGTPYGRLRRSRLAVADTTLWRPCQAGNIWHGLRDRAVRRYVGTSASKWAGTW